MNGIVVIHDTECIEYTREKNSEGIHKKRYCIHSSGEVTCIQVGEGIDIPIPQEIHIFLSNCFGRSSSSRRELQNSAQFISLVSLVSSLARRYGIRFDQVIKHDQCCLGNDFPWEDLEWQLFRRLN